MSLLTLIRRHILLAGLVGSVLALVYAIAYHVIAPDEILATIVGMLANIVVAFILSSTYAKLSGDPRSRGSMVEAGLAQILAFMVATTVIYNLIPKP